MEPIITSCSWLTRGILALGFGAVFFWGYNILFKLRNKPEISLSENGGTEELLDNTTERYICHKKQLYAIKEKLSSENLVIFVNGPAGCGKSWTTLNGIKCWLEETKNEEKPKKVVI